MPANGDLLEFPAIPKERVERSNRPNNCVFVVHACLQTAPMRHFLKSCRSAFVVVGEPERIRSVRPPVESTHSLNLLSRTFGNKLSMVDVD